MECPQVVTQGRVVLGWQFGELDRFEFGHGQFMLRGKRAEFLHPLVGTGLPLKFHRIVHTQFPRTLGHCTAQRRSLRR
jgi:hypothetical protein